MKTTGKKDRGLPLLALLLSLALLCGCAGQAQSPNPDQPELPAAKQAEAAAPAESKDSAPTEDAKYAQEKAPQEKAAEAAAPESVQVEQPTAGEQPKGKEEPPKTETVPTDPAPEGNPAPAEPEKADTSATWQCTFSIRCDTVLANMARCDAGKQGIVPPDGAVLSAVSVPFSPGESVFDVLQRVCRDYGIHMEATWTPLYNSAYIEGIGNLYEMDVGELSGWMYRVNGWFPNYGCSRYSLADGDVVEWIYTCDLGNDIGGSSAAGG